MRSGGNERRPARVAIAVAAVTALTVTVAPGQVANASAVHHAAADKQPPRLYPSDITPALRKYRVYVHRRIAALVPAVHRLHARTVAGDVANAKAAWLAARTIWLRIGQDNKAYGIFGDLGQRIDGTAAGLRRGVRDTHFTGFHRIERDLWRTQDLKAARAHSAYLVKAVNHLSHIPMKEAIPTGIDGATGFILRSHEIIEDAERDTLSGNDEYGSGTTGASVIADARATDAVLDILAPLIKPRAPRLVAHARHDLARVIDVAKATKRHGHWTSVRSLSRRERQALDSAVGAANETLSPVPTVLRIDNT